MRIINIIWHLLINTGKKFKDDDPVIYSAGIAFFAIFSMPPVLIVIVYIAGFIFGERAVKGELSSQISDVIGPTGARDIEKIIESAWLSESSLITTIIGVATLIFSATVIFRFIQKSLNKIWHVKPKPTKTFLKFLQDRFISFALVVVLGFLMLASLALDAFLAVIRNFFNDNYDGNTILLFQIMNFVMSFTVVTVIFGLIFKFLPDVKIKWRHVGIGALFTATLFIIGKFIIGAILRSTSVASTYGAAGSLAAILIWIFYSTLILFVGCEFTREFSEHSGSPIIPKGHAVKLEDKEVEFD